MDWQPIETAPIGVIVDVWCVYGDEEFAQYDGGHPIGQLVANQHKHAKYGWFGNQSSDGVPRGSDPDLRPVAWRKTSVCPPELIAAVMGIPLTLQEAIAAMDNDPPQPIVGAKVGTGDDAKT